MASPGANRREQPPPLSHADARERQKHTAALAAAGLVHDGMRLGLGTGSTVAHLLPAVAELQLSDLACVASSPQTERAARSLGLQLHALEDVGELDLYIDGADQIDPVGWLIKGGGGAHTREKILATASRRFVVIASADKAVARLTPPVPLELVPFGVGATLRSLAEAGLREVPASPDGGLIADYLGPVGDPAQLAARLSATPGVVEHGLFDPQLVSEIVIAGEAGVERRVPTRTAEPRAR
jgi:ribose 5-phosphate isomerase A